MSITSDALSWGPQGGQQFMDTGPIRDQMEKYRQKYMVGSPQNIAPTNVAGSSQYAAGMQGFANNISPSAPSVGANRFEQGLAGAEGRVNSLLDSPDSIQQSAAYKFRLGQGQQALERSMSAKGMLGSGNRLMDLTKYGQDMASQEYDNQFSRVNSLLNNYSGNWNAAQGTQAQQYIGELGVKRNALSDLMTNETQNRKITEDAQSAKYQNDPFSEYWRQGAGGGSGGLTVRTV